MFENIFKKEKEEIGSELVGKPALYSLNGRPPFDLKGTVMRENIADVLIQPGNNSTGGYAVRKLAGQYIMISEE